jgi:hypothetical protein
MFHAHSLLFIFAVPIAVAVLLYTLRIHKLSFYELRRDWPQVVAAFLLFAVTVVPFALAMARTIPTVNAQAFTNFTRASNQFMPIGEYFADEHFRWGSQFLGNCPELNRYVIVTVLAFGAWAAYRRQRPRETTVVLLATLAVCLFLQLPASEWFHSHLPGARYLQYPWRLNAFMTPILIVLLVLAAGSNADSSEKAARAVHVITYSCLLLSLQFPFHALSLSYPHFSAQDIATNLSDLSDDVAGVEYLPTGAHYAPATASKHIKNGRRGHTNVGLPPNSVPPSQPLVSSDCLTGAWATELSGRDLVVDSSQETECNVFVRQFVSPALSLSLDNARLLPSAEDGYRILMGSGRAHVSLRQKRVGELALEYFWMPSRAE